MIEINSFCCKLIFDVYINGDIVYSQVFMEVEESEKFCFEVNDDDDVLDFEIVLLLLSSVFFGLCIV